MKGESHVLGIPIPKTLVIWALYITRVLGMGMPKTRGCPYHWDTASFPFPSFFPSYFHVRAFSPRTLLSQSLERDPTNTRPPDLLPTNTRHFAFSPQIARQIIQDGGNLVTRVGVCTGVYNLLSSQRLPA